MSRSNSTSIFRHNDRVEALWPSENKWYPARVCKVLPGNLFRIRFDGFKEQYDYQADQMRQPASLIIMCASQCTAALAVVCRGLERAARAQAVMFQSCLQCSAKACVLLLMLLCCFAPALSQPPPSTLSTATTCPISAAEFAASSMISASVDAAAGTMTIKYTGCPRHNWSTQTTPNRATFSCDSLTVKWPPTIQAVSNARTIGVYTSKAGSGAKNSRPLQGTIGITLDAVALFGNGDAQMRDAFVFEGMTFDSTCGGHASPTGQFHYHSEPKSGCVAAAAAAGLHSPLLGIMMDGVPLYGALGDGGSAPSDLDECNGHRDTSNAFYHYHVTPNMQYPYLVNCLRGCFTTGSCTADPTIPAMTYDGVKEQIVALSSRDYFCTGAGLPEAAIIAIIVCSCIAGLALIVAAVWYIRRRRRMNAANTSCSSASPPPCAPAPPATVAEMKPVQSLPGVVQAQWPQQLQDQHTLHQA